MPRRGKSLERRVDDALGRAARDLLLEVGYANLTIEAVAARAGVGKGAVYRRWASKAELVFAAGLHGPAGRPAPDTGSLRGDLVALVEDALGMLTAPGAAQAVPGLLADLARDPELERRFEATFFAEARMRIAAVLEAAARRGDLPGPEPDADLALGLLIGPLFAWLFVLRTPAAPDFAKELARSSRVKASSAELAVVVRALATDAESELRSSWSRVPTVGRGARLRAPARRS